MRSGALIAALALLMVVVAASLAAFDPRAFSGHMSVHMALVAVIAPLFACGISGTRLDPTISWGPGAAILLSFVEFVVVWIWHVPVMRDLAELSVSMRLLEHATFLVAGALLWLACLGAGAQVERGLAGAVALLMTSMHMTLLGVLLTMSPRPLFGGDDVSCLGVTMTASQDQQVGGIIMLLVGAVVYLAGGVALVARFLGAPPMQPRKGIEL